MSVKAAFETTALCAVCKGAGYQAPPMLFAGKIDAEVLVIGQNPGEIRSNDYIRHMTAAMAAKAGDGDIYRTWYNWDFGTSTAQTRIADLLGPNWLSTYCFTNAVRCRTPGNESPSEQMIGECSHYTRKVYELAPRKGIIVLGRMALLQITGSTAASQWSSFISAEYGWIYYAPHFASTMWKVATAKRNSLNEFLEMIT